MCAEIEELLLNGIVSPNAELNTKIIKRDYTAKNGDKDAPLQVKSLDSENLKLEFSYLKNAWEESNKTKPETFQQMSDMMTIIQKFYDYFMGIGFIVLLPFLRTAIVLPVTSPCNPNILICFITRKQQLVS